MLRSTLLVILAAAPSLAPQEPAATTDAAVDAAISRYRAASRGLSVERVGPLAAEALQGLALDTLTVPQLEKLGGAFVLQVLPDDLRRQCDARLASLAQAEDVDAAVAAALRTSVLPRVGRRARGEDQAVTQQRTEVLAAAVRHPALAAAVRAGRGTMVFGCLFTFRTADLVTAGVLATLAACVHDEFPPAKVRDLLAFLDHALAGTSGIAAVEQARLRKIGVAVLDRAIPLHPAGELEATYLAHQRNQLQGAAALGKLLGHEAPRIDVLWTNHPGQLKSFADLRGKVVIVDFFATWCGPCVASFPHLRELVERYRDQPIVLLGITSIQGYHIDPKATEAASRRTDTKGKPEREFELMGEFVEKLEMTWPVVFTKQYVFNPDFGVRGIPHVAVIDAKGIVRWNHVNSRDLAARVDELLAEIGAGPASRATGNQLVEVDAGPATRATGK